MMMMMMMMMMILIWNVLCYFYYYYNPCYICLYRASEIVIPDISHHTFTQLLEYLYTDDVHITMDTAMNLFQVSSTMFQFIFIYIYHFYYLHNHHHLHYPLSSISALSIPFFEFLSPFPPSLFLPLFYSTSILTNRLLIVSVLID